ncbi:MAG: PHP domain-containing protein [Alistipes sp.]|nr:PHP domain-containing protein [Alistipes sp.]
MKRLLLLTLLAMVALPLSAQKNPDLRNLAKNPRQRTELILPQVNGYNIYKADLHVHTVYSDGWLSGRARAEEAFYDGLDIIAITDHIEYRPNEANFLRATKGYHKRLPEAKNYRVHRVPADKDGILADLNISFEEANKYGKRNGLLVIRGAEITREPDSVGHYNALFIKDANKIYHEDPEKAIRNARKQGALIMHNHPGWRRTTTAKNALHEKLYGAGLIDGVELVNGYSFGPKLIKRCLDEKLFMAGATDIHGLSAVSYTQRGYFRTCTFILAKECTHEAVKEALVEDRTLAFAANNVIGEESLVKALFNASVSMKVLYTNSKGEKTISLTNTSSIPYTLNRHKKGNGTVLAPFQSITMQVGKGKELGFWVLNMWTADDDTPNGKHPYFKYKIAEQE